MLPCLITTTFKDASFKVRRIATKVEAPRTVATANTVAAVFSPPIRRDGVEDIAVTKNADCSSTINHQLAPEHHRRGFGEHTRLGPSQVWCRASRPAQERFARLWSIISPWPP